MLHLIKFQSGHSCVIHAKWGNLGFKKPGSAPYDQVSIWTQLCIHAKCGNLGFKKPGSAVQKVWFCSSYTRASTATKIYSANFISTDRMDPGIEFDISIYLYLQILFQKRKSLPAKCLYKIQCLTWYERWLLEIEATSLRRPFWVRVPICATDRHVVYQLHLDLVWLRILIRSVLLTN